jgi:hypothetical protein
MQFLKKLIIFLAISGASITLLGFVISDEAVIARSRFMKASPELIFGELEDFRNWKKWHPWALSDPNIKHVIKGARKGQGSKLRWSSEVFGSGTVKIVDARPPGFLLLDLAFVDQHLTGKASFKLVKEANGIRVIWVEILDLGNNPYRRWRGKFLNNVWGERFEDGLLRLKQLSEEAQEQADADAQRAAESAQDPSSSQSFEEPPVLGTPP